MNTFSSSTTKDLFFMQKALQLSLKNYLKTIPNPWVGCIIVKNDKIIGSGYHQGPGTQHAEVVALKKAKQPTQGATLYTTLEPCCHTGKTGPCSQLIIQHQIERVVIGVMDPDPRVCGKGIEILQKAGIKVCVGVLQEEITASLRPYLIHRTYERPLVWLKAAISIDGKIADSHSKSQWISSSPARIDAHFIRSQCQGIIIGKNTAIQDNPQLTVRLPNKEPLLPPIRIIYDAMATSASTTYLTDVTLAPTLFFVSHDCSQKRISELTKKGIEVVYSPLDPKTGKIDLLFSLRHLAQRGIMQVLLEGGSSLFSSFLNQTLIDKLSLYIGSKILGSQALSLFSHSQNFNIDACPQLIYRNTHVLDQTVRLDYDIEN